jgi:putative ABC transport system permease protein
MIMPTYWRVALISLKSTPIRTSLTTLGIVIGVMSITIVLSLGEGIRQSVIGQTLSNHKDTIIIQPNSFDSSFSASKISPFSSLSASTLNESDYALLKNTDGVAAISPLLNISSNVKFNGNSIKSPVVAASSDLAKIAHLETHSGQFLDSEDSGTVVLGSKLAGKLLGTDNASGQQINIRGIALSVVGVLKATNNPYSVIGTDIDQTAFVSLASSRLISGGPVNIKAFIASRNDNIKINDLARNITAQLIKNHKGETDFTALPATQISQKDNAIYDILVNTTAVVSVISLVVGGVGIMNIMLVSVTERTREIGIRKAIGATHAQIRAQFLTEAVVMTFMGGIIGVILAYISSYIIGIFLFVQPAINYKIILIALGLAVSTGIVFGLFPAIKASRKDPIEALRQYQ